jgi:DNA-binding HxlR family transcriptional regulator
MANINPESATDPLSSAAPDRQPVHVLLELLGQRWALRIIWELRGNPLGFRPLQAACDDVSPSVLNQRLHELRRSRLVVRSAEGYTLTRYGLSLLGVLAPLKEWSGEWVREARIQAEQEQEAEASQV